MNLAVEFGLLGILGGFSVILPMPRKHFSQERPLSGGFGLGLWFHCPAFFSAMPHLIESSSEEQQHLDEEVLS